MTQAQLGCLEVGWNTPAWICDTDVCISQKILWDGG